jgi:hypothetical protein
MALPAVDIPRRSHGPRRGRSDRGRGAAVRLAQVVEFHAGSVEEGEVKGGDRAYELVERARPTAWSALGVVVSHLWTRPDRNCEGAQAVTDKPGVARRHGENLDDAAALAVLIAKICLPVSSSAGICDRFLKERSLSFRGHARGLCDGIADRLGIAISGVGASSEQVDSAGEEA